MLAVSRTFTKEPSRATNCPLRNDHAWIFSRTHRQTIHDLNNWFTVCRLSSFLFFFYANYSNNDNDVNYCIETVFKTFCRLLWFWVFRNERQKKLQWKLMINTSIKKTTWRLQKGRELHNFFRKFCCLWKKYLMDCLEVVHISHWIFMLRF